MTRFFSNQTIRKPFVLLILISFFQISFTNAFLDDKQIMVPDFKGTAKQLLDQISKNENLVFAYSSEVSLDFSVNYEKAEMELSNFLELLLKGKPIAYKIKGNKVQLFPKSSTADETKKLSQTVRGTIIDADSKLPLIGSNVVIVGTNPAIATSTDTTGAFKFENIAIGRIALQVTYIGYESLNISEVVINSGKEVVLELSMQESVIKLEDVVVKTSRKGDATNDMALLSSHSISVNETKRYTGGMDDLARVASSFAGVACTASGGSDIIVRGNSPKYLQWRLDGIEISSPYHMDDQNASAGALTALNNSLLAATDFYTGAFSPEYGNVLSSVMDVKLRTGNNEKFEAAYGLGLMGTDLTLEGPFKKGYAGSYLVNYRYSSISLLNKIGILDIPAVVDYQDATFKVVLPTKKIGTFSVFGLGGLSGILMNNAIQVPTTTIKDAAISKDFDKSNYLSNLSLSHTLSINANSYIKTSLSYSASGIDDELIEGYTLKKYDGNGAFVSDSVVDKKQKFTNEIENSTYRAAIVYNTKMSAKDKIQIGAKYTLNSNKYFQNLYNEQVGALLNVTDFNKNINTLNNFASWKHSFNDNISFVAGIHNMNVLLNKKSTLEPRFGVNWKINHSNAIHAGYGKHSTMENPHNYYTKLVLADGSTFEPNKELDLLKANHYVLGYKKYFTDNLVAKIEAYYQNLYNLPVENLDTSYYATINEGVEYRYVALVNEGTSENYGFEITLEKFFNESYYFLINTSIYESKYKALEGVWRNTQYNGNYMLNLLFGKEFKNLGRKQNKTLALNSKVFFSGGKRYIPLIRDAQGNVDVDPVNNRYWDYKQAYNKRLENVFQLNLSISYKINKATTTHEIFLDLMNLTDNRAKIGEYYDASAPEKIGYITQFQLFPNLMYRVYF